MGCEDATGRITLRARPLSPEAPTDTIVAAVEFAKYSRSTQKARRGEIMAKFKKTSVGRRGFLKNAAAGAAALVTTTPLAEAQAQGTQAQSAQAQNRGGAAPAGVAPAPT